MYHLSRQQLIWCWRCTSCQDSICYSAEDIPAVKTAADMLLKMYQLSRQQLPSYWRCTSCQDSSQNRSYFLFCWRAVKTAVPAHKTEAASLLKIYQLSRQKLLFLQKMYQLACSCILRQTKIESLSGQVHFISVKMHSGPTPNSIAQGNWLPVYIVEMVYYHTPRVWWTIPPKRKKPVTTLRKRIVFDFFYIITPVSYLPSIS